VVNKDEYIFTPSDIARHSSAKRDKRRISREQDIGDFRIAALFKAHVTRDSDTIFKVKRSKSNLQGTEAYCGGLPHSLFVRRKTSNCDDDNEISVLLK